MAPIPVEFTMPQMNTPGGACGQIRYHSTTERWILEAKLREVRGGSERPTVFHFRKTGYAVRYPSRRYGESL